MPSVGVFHNRSTCSHSYAVTPYAAGTTLFFLPLRMEILWFHVLKYVEPLPNMKMSTRQLLVGTYCSGMTVNRCSFSLDQLSAPTPETYPSKGCATLLAFRHHEDVPCTFGTKAKSAALLLRGVDYTDFIGESLTKGSTSVAIVVFPSH